MGIICKGNNFCQDYELVRNCQNFNLQISENNLNNSNEKIFYNGKSINNDQLILSKKYYELLNEIRENPSNFIDESKEHQLFEIFLKLKPSKPLKFSENNILDIIYYLEESQHKSFTDEQKEKGIKSLINNGNVSNICLFQLVALFNDVKENIWQFLEDNEDDIDKILTVNYDYIMVICLPIENNNNKSIVTFIFYDE